MRILQVITSLLPGGAEKLVSDLLPYFRNEGAEVEIAVFNAVETSLMQQLREQGFKIHRFAHEGCNVYSPANMVKLQFLLWTGKFDIVHTHNTASQLFGAICRVHRSTKKITTEHITINRRRKFGLLKYSDRLMYAAYDKVVCVSTPTLHALTEFVGGKIAEKCEVITNGIDLKRYKGKIKETNHGKNIIVAMVASFRKQKDQDTAVKAFTLLPNKFRLRLIGDGERIDEVRRLASDLGLSQRVEFMGFRDDIPDLLQDSDIVLLSSHYEGFSLSNIEGMASGRPFVASEVAGLSEVTHDAGILFPEGDHIELARIILNICNDPDLYACTAAKCMKRALGFDIKHTADRYMRMYRQVLTCD